MNANTWRAISCAEDKRFSDESQVRSYLVDYLLDEIKDAGTRCFRECACFRGSPPQRTGVADYFVQIAGQWLPVEAKLNIHAERDILAQVQQYTHIDHFHGPQWQRYMVPRQPYCLVIDQEGLYLCKNDAFVTTAGHLVPTLPGEPLITRRALGQLANDTVRERLRALLSVS